MERHRGWRLLWLKHIRCLDEREGHRALPPHDHRPGDLVLDPTCGAGTTAYVAEQWGRRWITIDVSRVALAIARQRLLTAKFDYYKLRPTSAEDVQRNPDGTWLTDPDGQMQGSCTFDCKTVPHVTLKSIAQNQALDPIFEKWEPILADKLTASTRPSPKP